jgi:hypothetical protein
MRNLFGTWLPGEFSCTDKFLFRSLTYFKTLDAIFDVPSGLIFAVIY